MTSAPVPLAEQKRIDALPTRIWSGEHEAYWRKGGAGYTQRAALAWILPLSEARLRTAHCGPEKQIDLEIAHDHLDALQQHERAIAALREIARMLSEIGDALEAHGIVSNDLEIARQKALAALDAAANTAGDAVTTEEAKSHPGAAMPDPPRA